MADCKATVYGDSAWDRAHQCSRKAVTEAGYCRQHDPDLAKKRAAGRPPAKFERKSEVRRILEQFIRSRLPESDAENLINAICLGWASWMTPSWPLPEWLTDMALDKEATQ